MWGKKKPTSGAGSIDSLIGPKTEIRGDVFFSGGLHIDGKVKGNVTAVEGAASTLILSNQGEIEGEVRVSHLMLNGKVMGDVYSSESVELASEARVQGNVYYNLLEMAMGAEVNGSLVHVKEGAGYQAAGPRETAAQEEVVESAIMGYLDANTQSKT